MKKHNSCVTMASKIRQFFCRHTWRPIKVEYRYPEYRGGRIITCKKCQCVKCNKIAYIHFHDKTIIN